MPTFIRLFWSQIVAFVLKVKLDVNSVIKTVESRFSEVKKATADAETVVDKTIDTVKDKIHKSKPYVERVKQVAFLFIKLLIIVFVTIFNILKSIGEFLVKRFKAVLIGIGILVIAFFFGKIVGSKTSGGNVGSNTKNPIAEKIAEEADKVKDKIDEATAKVDKASEAADAIIDTITSTDKSLDEIASEDVATRTKMAEDLGFKKEQ